MTGRRPTGLLVAVGWAVAGLLGGHVVTYQILFPDAHAQAEALEATGHGWLALLGPALVIALLVALASGLLGRQRARGRGVRFAMLALVQVGFFLALELAERFGGGYSPWLLDHQIRAHALLQILLLGSVIQLACAWLGSAASRLVATVARPTGLRPRRRLAIPHLLAPRSLLPVPRTLRANGSRGPPLLDRVACSTT